MASTELTNLASHRAPGSVWDKRGWQGATIEERLAPWFVSLAGAGIFAYGASRRSWRGAWFIASGAALVAYAASGLCDPHNASMRWHRGIHRSAKADAVTTESMDSFPASDAPSSNAGGTA